MHERVVVDETVFAEIGIWQVPDPVRGSRHRLKYGLALVASGVCVLRCDNEAGKGDHRHLADGREVPYAFTGTDALVGDFWKDVDEWMAGRTGATT